MGKDEKDPVVNPSTTRPYNPPLRQGPTPAFSAEDKVTQEMAVTVAEKKIVNVPLELFPYITTLQLTYDDADTGEGDPFVFPQITGRALEKIVRYYSYYHQNPNRLDKPSDPRFHENENRYKLDSYELATISTMTNDALVEGIECSNFLDCADYRWALIAELANRMERQTSVENLRKMLNVRDDFTPADKEVLERPESWIYSINTRVTDDGRVEQIPNVIGFRPKGMAAVSMPTETGSAATSSADEDVMAWE